MTPIIQVQDLGKSFELRGTAPGTVREQVLAPWRRRRPERLEVLAGVTFDVARGETLGIMGRNGCGKSTLLKVLAGILLPDGGSVRVSDVVTPILELGMGWNGELDAVENIRLLGTVLGMSLEEAEAATGEILAFAGLQRFARMELKRYSSGMAARLAYSVAFHAVRGILILDEVFAVGDAGFRERCLDRQRQLSGAGHTVLLVTHEPRFIREFCHRALLLEGGRVQVEGDPDEVADAYLELLTGAAPEPSAQTVAGGDPFELSER